jgi:hypothetical protein
MHENWSTQLSICDYVTPIIVANAPSIWNLKQKPLVTSAKVDDPIADPFNILMHVKNLL